MRRPPRTPGPIHVAVIVLLVYVAIGALNTLAIAALARRAELAILRLVGATGDQVLRMARIEQAMLLGLAPIAGGGHRRAENRSA
jgi:putative ABC transport system permease protein